MKPHLPGPVRRSAVSATSAPLLVAVLLAGCGGEAPAPQPEVRPVRTALARAGSGERLRTLTGVARAGVESRLSFRVGGAVSEIAVVLGDRVRPGQVLARLDPRDYELQVEQAEAGLAEARAGLRRAEADYERVRALYENNNAAKSELDAARAAAESAQAQVEARGKQLELARQQVGYTVLQAPTGGSVASVDVEVNENVAAGQQVFLLTAGGEPEVEIAVPEVVIGRVEAGQPVEVRFDALPGEVLGGEVSEVGVAVTGAASTYPVRVRLAGRGDEVRPGMAAEVTLRFAAGIPGVVVPAVAVGEDREGRFVFVVEEGEGGEAVVRRRAVELARTEPGAEGIVLGRGLEAGERVVTAGVRRLADGQRVRLLAVREEGAAAADGTEG